VPDRWILSRRPTRSALALVTAPILALASLAAFAATATATASGAPIARKPNAALGVAPGKSNMMDCNGWSPKYKSFSFSFRMRCADPRGKIGAHQPPWVADGRIYQSNGRFMDNGHYVGHDEPSVKFISSAPNSGNTFTYYVKLPVDPARPPTNSGTVVDYAELSIAPWFGLPLCDPESYPQNPCTPDSDRNIGANTPKAAGSGFLELQLFPPGFAPFVDDVSCSRRSWCAAIGVFGLESQFNFKNMNENCPETESFAFLQNNGIPTGPPGPQKIDLATFLPNAHTLLMGQGDVLKVSITDPKAGITATIHDLTTSQTGFMTASARNGFMETSFKNCRGIRHTFHAEYDTARAQNQVPWITLDGGVMMAQEAGHSELCSSLTDRDYESTGSYKDFDVYDGCAEEGNNHRHEAGEGGCNLNTFICKNPTTEGTAGPIPCPKKSFLSGQLCEFADSACRPKGFRPVTIHGHKAREYSPVTLCLQNRFQDGDLDFDGLSYQNGKWPDGSKDSPTSMRYAGPFDGSGAPYPQIQFETDIGGSEFLCNIFTGQNCDAPPLSAKFYPFWSLTSARGQGIGRLFTSPDCIWNFGAKIPGVTRYAFGGDGQYGHVTKTGAFGGTLISKIRANPEVNRKLGCRVLRDPVKAAR